MSSSVLRVESLGFVWPTVDPFLFCVHHDDAYPRGNAAFGPDAPLAGRQIGNDFEGIDGWRMYHGRTVPGFPAHPHRGFETVTVVRRGLIDHADSLGAAARYGHGDVQWLTTGAGVVHSEMFPLLDRAAPNPAELFQIWLNLPAASKMADPHFTMFWSDDIPKLEADGVEVTCIAGDVGGVRSLAPPPASWASNPASDVAIWTLRLAPGARWTVPAAASAGTRRMLYVFAGDGVSIAGERIDRHAAVELDAAVPVSLQAGNAAVECLLLQGRPLDEPVVQHGPFVMNTRAELQQAFADYQRTGFGGWPWADDAPVHGGPEHGRFARRPGGLIEKPAA